MKERGLHGSKAAALAMAFKLIESAQRRWRMVNAPHLVALVRAWATFVNGKLVERPEDEAGGGPAGSRLTSSRTLLGTLAWWHEVRTAARSVSDLGPGLRVPC